MRSLRAICGCVIQSSRIALTMTAAVAAATASDVRADSPFASSVVSYVAGSGAVAGFTELKDKVEAKGDELIGKLDAADGN